MAHPGAKEIEVDGFVPPAYRTGERSPFDRSKIGLFKELIGLRRKGMGFSGTDLGRVLDARPLSSEFEITNEHLTFYVNRLPTRPLASRAAFWMASLRWLQATWEMHMQQNMGRMQGLALTWRIGM
ncbi:hypothetical protein BGW80DRAFT_1290292, partial [Lactifluus volemus]